MREATYRRALACADIVAASAALAELPNLGSGRLRTSAVFALPVVVLVNKAAGLYDRDGLRLLKSTLEETPALFQVATLCTVLAKLAEGTLVTTPLGHLQLLGLWVGLFVLLVCCRAGARLLARAIAPEERCLLVGDADAADRIAAKLTDNPRIRAVFAGRIGTPSPERSSLETLGLDHALEDVIARHDVHRVVFSPRETEPDGMSEQIETATRLGVRVSVLPRVFEAVGSSVEFDDLDGLTLLGVRNVGLTRSSQLVKRGFDALVAAIALVVLAPLMLVIALAIRASSPGAVIFRQTRVGRDGAPLTMLKFRTMLDGADEVRAALTPLNEAGDGLFKIIDDPRVTAVGRLLRRVSFDELPQLWNVLRGDMSLVGPRPLVPEEDRLVQGWYRRRLQLTPGMTGNWQILGPARIPLDEMITIDYLYIANWSIWTDVKILLRTAAHVAARRGA